VSRWSDAARYRAKPELAARRGKALTMRNAGATWEAIAEALGVSTETARKDVAQMIREAVRIPAEQMVDRQRAILLDIVRTEYPTAMDKNAAPEARHGAQGRILDCLAHEAKLFGLYAPTRVAVAPTEAEFATRALELLAVVGVEPLAELARANVGEAQVVEEDDDWSNL